MLSVPPGPQVFAHWKKKISWYDVIAGTIDNRTLAGLRKAWKRLDDKFNEGKEQDGGVARGQLKGLCDIAATLQTLMLPAVKIRPDAEVASALKLAKREGWFCHQTLALL